MVPRGWHDRVRPASGSVKELGRVVVRVVRGEPVGAGWPTHRGELVEGQQHIRDEGITGDISCRVGQVVRIALWHAGVVFSHVVVDWGWIL